VILHGLFLYSQEGTRLKIYVPKVNGQVYLAGNYEQEQPIPETTTPLTINGIDQQSSTQMFDEDLNPVLGGFTTGPGAYAVFDLPAPHVVHSLRLITRGVEADFQGPDAAKITATKMSLSEVLQYQFADVNKLGIDAIPGWTPLLDSSTGTVNLLIFVQPPTGHLNPHSVSTAFDEVMKLVPGANLQLMVNEDAHPAPQDPGIPGVSINDMKDLFERGIQPHANPSDCMGLVLKPPAVPA
jgi:hypothetical protein